MYKKDEDMFGLNHIECSIFFHMTVFTMLTKTYDKETLNITTTCFNLQASP